MLGWKIELLANRLVDCLIGDVDRLPGWLAGWLLGFLAGWLVGFFVILFASSVCCFVGWSVGFAFVNEWLVG